MPPVFFLLESVVEKLFNEENGCEVERGRGSAKRPKRRRRRAGVSIRSRLLLSFFLLSLAFVFFSFPSRWDACSQPSRTCSRGRRPRAGRETAATRMSRPPLFVFLFFFLNDECERKREREIENFD